MHVQRESDKFETTIIGDEYLYTENRSNFINFINFIVK